MAAEAAAKVQTSGDQRQGDLGESLALAARRFNAWWEGYAFDASAEREVIRKTAGSACAPTIQPEFHIAHSIWRDGRLDPGSPAWTMSHARTLGVGLKSRVVVLGAGAGGPLRDLKAGTKWKLSGYTHYQGPPQVSIRGASLHRYANVISQLNKASGDGGLCFFELHRDKDPSSFAMFAAELVHANAPFSFVDFTISRREARVRSAFAAPWQGAPRTVEEYNALLEGAGFRIVDTTNESRAFTPLIARGWARWKTTYDQAKSITDPRQRAECVNVLGKYAHLWAERLDALKAGYLQVTRILTRKT